MACPFRRFEVAFFISLRICLLSCVILAGCSKDENANEKLRSTPDTSSKGGEISNLSLDDDGVLFAITLDGKSNGLVDEIKRHPGQIGIVNLKGQIDQKTASILNDIASLKRIEKVSNLRLYLKPSDKIDQRACTQIFDLVAARAIHVNLSGTFPEQNRLMGTFIQSIRHSKSRIKSLFVTGDFDPIRCIDSLGALSPDHLGFLFLREPSSEPRHFSLQRLIDTAEPRSKMLMLSSISTDKISLTLNDVFPKFKSNSVFMGFGEFKELPKTPEDFEKAPRGVYRDLSIDEITDVVVLYRGAD